MHSSEILATQTTIGKEQEMSIEFFVEGRPLPSGSKRGFAIKKGGQYTGKAIVVDANKNSVYWKQKVALTANDNYNGKPLSGPVIVEMEFYFRRPKSHFGTGKNSGVLKRSSPDHHTIKPDLLKLARAVEDALSGIIYNDDSQIVQEFLEKNYCDDIEKPEGVLVRVEQLSSVTEN